MKNAFLVPIVYLLVFSASSVIAEDCVPNSIVHPGVHGNGRELMFHWKDLVGIQQSTSIEFVSKVGSYYELDVPIRRKPGDIKPIFGKVKSSNSNVCIVESTGDIRLDKANVTDPVHVKFTIQNDLKALGVRFNSNADDAVTAVFTTEANPPDPGHGPLPGTFTAHGKPKVNTDRTVLSFYLSNIHMSSPDKHYVYVIWLLDANGKEVRVDPKIVNQ